MKKRYALLAMLPVLAIWACRKPYDPPAIASPLSYLVVEGVIAGNPDSTYITLSRIVNLSASSANNPELKATVAVESDQQVNYPLTELGNGVYACAPLNLSTTHQYRLTITTANGQQFVSDYVSVLDAPPIDSITYDTKGTSQGPGLNVYVNAHDATNTIKYYRWEYQETWVIHSQFQSNYYSNGDTVLLRNQATQNITDCWDSDTSNTIILGSSAKLTKAIISQQPLTSVASTSQKVSNEYSIFVKQYAITSEAYIFYQNMQKNSEQLGTIFDPQPSQINGNLHCVTNPSQPVIGYISAGGAATKRVFIYNSSLPQWRTTPVPSDCTLAFEDSVEVQSQPPSCCYYQFVNNDGTVTNQVNTYINYLIGYHSNPLIPLTAIGEPEHPPIGYTATTRACADCTLYGTNKRPSFWQ